MKRLAVAVGIVLLSSSSVGQASMLLHGMRAPTWKQIATSNAPSPRASFAMAYDPVSGKVVVFGGYGSKRYLDDTWTFDGTNWVQQTPSSAPPPRAGSAMAFDAKTKMIVLFGGYNGAKYLGDTWLWNGATAQWTEAQPAHSPVAMTGPALFTDPLDRRADEYGGFDGIFYHGDTWRWRGTTWRKLHTPTEAYARSIPVYGTNPRMRSTVVFGGLGSLNPDNTWTWNGKAWTEQSPSSQPLLVYDAAAAYEPKMNAILKFGGGSGGVDQNDTWAWNGTTWTQLSPAMSPSPRESVRMAYDERIRRVVLFGGIFYSKGQLFNDTWEFLP